MNVKRDIRNLPERGDNAHPERDGWYKHAVHDINVQIFRPRLFNPFNLLSQLGTVRCQDGW